MAKKVSPEEQLVNFLKTYEDGILEEILNSKQLDFTKSIFLNDVMIITIILLPRKELEAIKDLPANEVKQILYRHIIPGLAKTTEELGSRYHKTYMHKYLFIQNTNKSTECLVGDTETGARIKKYDAGITGLDEYRSYFIASKIIPASEWLERIPAAAKGRVPNASVASDAVVPTRIKTRRMFVKSTKDYNFSYAFHQSALCLRYLAIETYNLTSWLLFPSPLAILNLALNGGEHGNKQRLMYTWATANTSFVETPFDLYWQFFDDTKESMFNSDNFKLVTKTLEQLPKKDQYTYTDLCDVIKKVLGADCNAEAKLYFDYMFYIEHGLIEHHFNEVTKEGSAAIVNEFFEESDKLAIPETLKSMTFPSAFVFSPCFLYIGMTEADLGKIETARAIDTLNLLKNVHTYYNLCQKHDDACSINKIYPENMQRLFTYCKVNNISVGERDTSSRTKSFFKITENTNDINFMPLIAPT